MRLLKALKIEQLHHPLDGEELRLYLLLIATCDNNGEGRLASKTIEKALGRQFREEILSPAIASLEEKGLIELLPPSRTGYTSSKEPLTYRLMQEKRN